MNSYNEQVINSNRANADTAMRIATVCAFRMRPFVLTVSLLTATAAHALECGNFKFPKCDGRDVQYAGGFDPKTGYGGFGGGNCTPVKTPVVFIHGNADRAINWDSPVDGQVTGYQPPTRSVYEEFKQQGYNDCELFGVTYLNEAEQESPRFNYHRPEKYQILHDFIQAVKAYTGKDQVDLVTYSMGVSMTLATLKFNDDWGSVRRFVNIAGGIRGLNSCLYANMPPPTCGSENLLDRRVFGFYPDMLGNNHWTGATGEYSLRRAPLLHPKVRFYTLHAGKQDQVHCNALRGWNDCAKGALFETRSNVKAQLNLGAGLPAEQVDLNFADLSAFNLMGGDIDGVGHWKAKNNSGQILFTMLNSDCTGLACRADYAGGPVKAEAQ